MRGIVMIMVAMIIVVIMIGRAVMVIMHRRGMRIMVSAAEFDVHNGMGAPIGMDALPVIETVQADGIHHDPGVTGAEVVVLATDDADIFITVPIVIIGRNGYGYDRRRWG
jgi:hypothetical protein